MRLFLFYILHFLEAILRLLVGLIIFLANWLRHWKLQLKENVQGIDTNPLEVANGLDSAPQHWLEQTQTPPPKHWLTYIKERNPDLFKQWDLEVKQQKTLIDTVRVQNFEPLQTKPLQTKPLQTEPLQTVNLDVSKDASEMNSLSTSRLRFSLIPKASQPEVSVDEDTLGSGLEPKETLPQNIQEAQNQEHSNNKPQSTQNQNQIKVKGLEHLQANVLPDHWLNHIQERNPDLLEQWDLRVKQQKSTSKPLNKSKRRKFWKPSIFRQSKDNDSVGVQNLEPFQMDMNSNVSRQASKVTPAPPPRLRFSLFQKPNSQSEGAILEDRVFDGLEQKERQQTQEAFYKNLPTNTQEPSQQNRKSIRQNSLIKQTKTILSRLRKNISINQTDLTATTVKEQPINSNLNSSSQFESKNNQNKNNQNKDSQSKDNLNKDNLNKDNLNKDNLNKDNLNKDNLNKDNLNKDNLNKDNLNKDNLNKDNLNKDNLSKPKQKILIPEYLNNENVGVQNLESFQTNTPPQTKHATSSKKSRRFPKPRFGQPKIITTNQEQPSYDVSFQNYELEPETKPKSIKDYWPKLPSELLLSREEVEEPNNTQSALALKKRLQQRRKELDLEQQGILWNE